jgi:hypothetical protein
LHDLGTRRFILGATGFASAIIAVATTRLIVPKSRNPIWVAVTQAIGIRGINRMSPTRVGAFAPAPH